MLFFGAPEIETISGAFSFSGVLESLITPCATAGGSERDLKYTHEFDWH
jgi:hypothetical protein